LSFWKYASFKLLRGIGICLVFIGILGGLIALGNHLTDGIILAIFFFVGGILLAWYSNFKIQTITITRGIRGAGGWETRYDLKPARHGRRKKLIFVGIGIVIAITLLITLFSSTTIPKAKTITGNLYFQPTVSDWSSGNFAMSPQIPNGDTQSEDMWHHSSNFISSPLKQNFAITELTFSLYYKIVPSDGNYFQIEVMFIDANGGVQTICTKSVALIENSRSTSYTVNFSNPPQLMENERLYVRITVATWAAWDWYWGNLNYPSHVTYRGVPQYEGTPSF
jgi:hypothetical protein